VDVTEDVELHKGINAAIAKQNCLISRPKLNDRYGLRFQPVNATSKLLL